MNSTMFSTDRSHWKKHDAVQGLDNSMEKFYSVEGQWYSEMPFLQVLMTHSYGRKIIVKTYKQLCRETEIPCHLEFSFSSKGKNWRTRFTAPNYPFTKSQKGWSGRWATSWFKAQNLKNESAAYTYLSIFTIYSSLHMSAL